MQYGMDARNLQAICLGRILLHQDNRESSCVHVHYQSYFLTSKKWRKRFAFAVPGCFQPTPTYTPGPTALR